MEQRTKRPFMALWARGLVWQLAISAVGLCVGCVCLVGILLFADAASGLAMEYDAENLFTNNTLN